MIGKNKDEGTMVAKCQRFDFAAERYIHGTAPTPRAGYTDDPAIQERNGSNVPEVSYTRGWDLSSSLEGAGGIGGLLARSHGYSSGAWSTHNFYHADGNGNVTMMLDSSQALLSWLLFNCDERPKSDSI